MDLLMDRARIVRGLFRFRAPLKTHQMPYSFGWSLKVLNSDAVTKWEFYHLYCEEQRCHIDDAAFDAPIEYFARAVWFPIRRLELILERPEPDSSVSCYELMNNPSIPTEEVVHGDGIVRIYPNLDSEWSKANFKWQADLERQPMVTASLVRTSPALTTLTLDYPRVGSSFSIDWQLPASAPDEQFDRLIEEAEELRDALLAHRESRKGCALLNEPQDREFSMFYEEIANDCGLRSERGDFEVVLMTYRKSDARLVMVDGRTNGNTMSEALWEFWLPFGMGLAGACFRAGGNVFRYLRPREEDAEREEFYLKIPGYKPHACLLALPVDHPDFEHPPDLGDTAPLPERCRQLIGVVTIGSTSLSAEMAQLCKEKLSKTEYDRLKRLRERCQTFGVRLCKTLGMRPGRTSGLLS